MVDLPLTDAYPKFSEESISFNSDGSVDGTSVYIGNWDDRTEYTEGGSSAHPYGFLWTAHPDYPDVFCHQVTVEPLGNWYDKCETGTTNNGLVKITLSYRRSPFLIRERFLLTRSITSEVIEITEGFRKYNDAGAVAEDVCRPGDIFSYKVVPVLTYTYNWISTVDVGDILEDLNGRINSAQVTDDDGNIYAAYTLLCMDQTTNEFQADNGTAQWNNTVTFGYKPDTTWRFAWSKRDGVYKRILTNPAAGVAAELYIATAFNVLPFFA